MGEAYKADGYAIEHEIGRGSMGIVHAARQTSTGRPVAIKWLSSRALERRPSTLTRFEREAAIVRTLVSRHVVEFVETGRSDDGAPFIVMERLEGEDVQTLLDRTGPLPPDVALRIAAQACLGLHVAHEAGVLHRDIKPANLFLARSNSGDVIVKVLDFGIAKIKAGHPDSLDDEARRTTAGRVMGSPHFLSPEQLRGKMTSTNVATFSPWA